MLPWKLFPAFALSRAGSSWPPRWNRNAVIDLGHRVRSRAPGQLVGEGRAVIHHLLLRDPVPDRQQNLFAADGPGHQPVELVSWPAFLEERL